MPRSATARAMVAIAIPTMLSTGVLTTPAYAGTITTTCVNRTTSGWANMDALLKDVWLKNSSKYKADNTRNFQITDKSFSIGKSASQTTYSMANQSSYVVSKTVATNSGSRKTNITTASATKTFKTQYTVSVTKGLSNLKSGNVDLGLGPIKGGFTGSLSTSLDNSASCTTWDEVSYTLPSQTIEVPARHSRDVTQSLSTYEGSASYEVKLTMSGNFDVKFQERDALYNYIWRDAKNQGLFDNVRRAVKDGYSLPSGFSLDYTNQKLVYSGTITVTGHDTGNYGNAYINIGAPYSCESTGCL